MRRAGSSPVPSGGRRYSTRRSPRPRSRAIPSASRAMNAAPSLHITRKRFHFSVKPPPGTCREPITMESAGSRSNSASSPGRSSGRCCPSASMQTRISPEAFEKPWTTLGARPRAPGFCSPRTEVRSVFAVSSAAASVPSGEWSSATIISKSGRSSASRARSIAGMLSFSRNVGRTTETVIIQPRKRKKKDGDQPSARYASCILKIFWIDAWQAGVSAALAAALSSFARAKRSMAPMFSQ